MECGSMEAAAVAAGVTQIVISRRVEFVVIEVRTPTPEPEVRVHDLLSELKAGLETASKHSVASEMQEVAANEDNHPGVVGAHGNPHMSVEGGLPGVVGAHGNPHMDIAGVLPGVVGAHGNPRMYDDDFLPGVVGAHGNPHAGSAEARDAVSMPGVVQLGIKEQLKAFGWQRNLGQITVPAKNGGYPKKKKKKKSETLRLDCDEEFDVLEEQKGFCSWWIVVLLVIAGCGICMWGKGSAIVPVSDYEFEVVGWDAQQQENYDYEYDEPVAEDFVDWLRGEALRELRRKAQRGEEITENFLFEVVGLGEALPDDEMVPIYKGELDWAADFGEVIDEFGVMGTADLILSRV